MTEQEWQSGRHCYPLLQSVRGRISHRKLRLFAVACCRRLAIPNARYLRMIEATERFADGLMTTRQFLSAFPSGDLRRSAVSVENVTRMAILALNWPDRELPRHEYDEQRDEIVAAAWESGEYAEHYTARIGLHANHAETLTQLGPAHRPGMNPEKFRTLLDTADWHHAELFREIVGNPFRPVAFDPDWRTSTATELARQMYESRTFDRMPILADALQDAGCEEMSIIEHCQSNSPHVRGCWVVDLVLGKA